MKKILLGLVLVAASFVLGFQFAIWNSGERLKALGQAKDIVLDVMADAQHVKFEEELGIRTEAIRHFVMADKDGILFNKAMKEYILSTEVIIDNIEKIGLEFSKRESRESIAASVKYAREEVERLKFGYHF